MRSLLIASTMLAIAAAPAIAKPTTAVTAWNLRAVLAPQVDLNFGTTPNWREPPLEIVQTATSPARVQTAQVAPGRALSATTGARP